MAARQTKRKKEPGQARAPQPRTRQAEGKKPPAKKRVTITFHAPQAHAVQVTGTFCNWQIDSYPLKKDRKGTWKTTLSLLPGCYEYRFFVDGHWQDDPNCPHRVLNSFGTHNCILQVAEGKESKGTRAGV